MSASTEFRGRQALAMIAARMDSDPDNPRIKYVGHIDSAGISSNSTESDFMWHLVDWAAHYDMASDKSRVVLFTGDRKYWAVELWNDRDRSNPEHVFYLHF